jgi:PIN domain nuclease of toxin-antitoxin system
VRIPLDTHAFLWFVLGDSKLSAAARAEIESPSNDKLLSPASNWEIAIKIRLGKYTIPTPFEDFIVKAIGDNGFEILPIEPKHAAALTSMPFHHKDPFDRMIIAQALVEGVSIIGCDLAFDAYSVTRIW